MAATRLQYCSVATNDIEAAIKRYEALGMTQNTELNEQRWGFRACMMGIGDTNVVEIIEPAGDDSALSRFMKMREGDAYPGGEGLYLIGMRIDDLAQTIAGIEAAGGRVTREADSPTTVWVHPASNGNVMIELSDGPPSQG